MRTPNSICALVALCLLSTLNTPAAQLSVYGRVLEINRELCLVCEAARTGTPEGYPVQAARLQRQLGHLDELDGSIAIVANTGFGRLAEIEVRRLQGIRAAAWLNAYTAWTHLVSVATDLPFELGNDLRKQLSYGDDSCLGLLLRTYGQIRMSMKDDQEPLRKALDQAEDLDLWLKLGFDARPGGERMQRTFPATRHILGMPADESEPRMGLLTVWGLVNLQLDSWHELIQGAWGEVAGNTMRTLPDLAALLGQLTVQLAALGGSEQSTLPRLERIRHYLLFRSALAADHGEGDFSQYLKQVQLRRLGRTDALKEPEALTHLRQAAEAVDGEILFDAAIWLRYLTLISFHQEGTDAVRDDNPNSVDALWKDQFGPASSFLIGQGTVAQAPDGSWLRWNQWPAETSGSAWIAGLVPATYQKLKFDLEGSGQEAKRFSFATGGRSEQANYIQFIQKRLYDLAQVQSLLGRWTPRASGAIRRTLTLREAESLEQDHSALADLVQLDYALLSREHDALQMIQQGNSMLSTGVEWLPASSPFSAVSVFRLPDRSFAEYAEDLRRAADQLDQAIQQAAVMDSRSYLNAEFSKARKLHQAATERAAAVAFGREMAAKAVQIANLYAEAGRIDVDLRELNQRIAVLEEEGLKAGTEAAQRASVYRQAQADLMKAQVEALEAAVEQTRNMIDAALKEIPRFQEELKLQAEGIEHQRSVSRKFGIFKAVVNLVGAALAPFTGGTSLMIATMVNAGINVGKNIADKNWQGAVAGICEIATAANKEFNLNLEIGPETKQFFAEWRTTIVEAGKTFNHYKKEAEQLYKQLIKQPNQKVKQLATAVANGVRVEVKRDKVVAKFGSHAVTFTNPLLQEALNGLYDYGGYLRTDLEQRTKELAKLVDLPDVELDEGLRRALDECISQLPDDLLDQTEEKKRQLREGYAKKREALIAAAGKLDTEAKRQFASALGSGLVFLQDGREAAKQVVAFTRDVEANLEKAELKAKKYEATLRSSLIKAKNELDRIWESVQAERTKAGDDPGRLRMVADSLTNQIPVIKSILLTSMDDLDAAKSEYEGARLQSEIADYELSARQLFLEAGQLRVEYATLDTQRIALLELARSRRVDQDKIGQEKAEAELRAAQAELEAAELNLRQTYLNCLARGFNPLVTADVQSTGMYLEWSLRNVMRLRMAPLDSMLESRTIRIGDSLLGMLQWLNMLKAKAFQSEPASYYAAAISELSELRQKNDAPARLQSFAGRVERQLSDSFAGITNKLGSYRLARTTIGAADMVRADQLLEDEIEGFNLPITRIVVNGRREIYYRNRRLIGTAAITVGEGTGIKVGLNNAYDSFALPGNALVINRQDSNTIYALHWVLLPPRRSIANPRSRMLSFDAWTNSEKLPADWQVIPGVLAEKLLHDARQIFGLAELRTTGAWGVWQILLLSDDKKAPLDELLLKVDLEFILPYIDVPLVK